VPAVSRGKQAGQFPAPAIGILRGAVQPGIAGGRSDDCAGTGAALGGSKRHPETARHPVKVAHQLRFDALGQEVGHCKSEFTPRLEMPIYGYAIIRQLDEHRRAVERGGSKGWVYVADRQNNRVQVFDQDGNFVAAWKQFGQPSSVYVDKNDNIYVGATYEAVAPGQTALRPTAGPNDRAIVIGNAISGELKYLIPDPGDLTRMTDTGTSASGIAVDDQGNLYAADVGFNNLRKYSRMR